MKSIQTTAKIATLLVLSVAVASLSFAWYQARRERRTLGAEVASRGEMLAGSLQDAVEPLFARGAGSSIQPLLANFSRRQSVKGIGVYDSEGTALNVTSSFGPSLRTRPP